MSIRWYIRWKLFQLRQDGPRTLRSPRTFMTLFIVFMGYGFFLGSKELIAESFMFFLLYYVWLDYSRGVPSKWKREKIVSDWNKKQERKQRREKGVGLNGGQNADGQDG